jgi:hypothetical protein
MTNAAQAPPLPGGSSDSISLAGLRRPELFAFLTLLAALNMYAAIALEAIRAHGAAAAIGNLMNVSAIVWFGYYAVFAILREDEQQAPAWRSDWAVAALVVAAALLPVGTASAAAFFLMSVYLFATSRRSTPLRRAAIVCLALAGIRFVAPLLMTALTQWLIAIDVRFVASLTGATAAANMIWDPNSPGSRLIVAPGCSSLAGVGLAITLWATLNQLFRVPLSARVATAGIAAVAATITINASRMALMLKHPELYDFIHDGGGAEISKWLTLFAVAGACLVGAKHEIFARE